MGKKNREKQERFTGERAAEDTSGIEQFKCKSLLAAAGGRRCPGIEGSSRLRSRRWELPPTLKLRHDKLARQAGFRNQESGFSGQTAGASPPEADGPKVRPRRNSVITIRIRRQQQSSGLRGVVTYNEVRIRRPEDHQTGRGCHAQVARNKYHVPQYRPNTRIPQVHRKAVRLLAGQHPDWFDAEWLPAYAPDLNPVEPAWAHTKYGDLANFIPEDVDDLYESVTDSMRGTCSNRDLIRSFFECAKLKL